MSTSNNSSQSLYSPSDSETTQVKAQNRIQSFDQIVNHVDLDRNIEQSLKSAQTEVHQKRIQALRNELEYIKSTNWEFEQDKGFAHNSTVVCDDADDIDEKFLSDQLFELEAANNENNITSLDPVENKSTMECFQKTGKVTFIGDDYILIDGNLFLEMTENSKKVNLNDRISYLGHRNENGNSIKAVRILSVDGPVWDENFEEENEQIGYKLIDHVIVGEVISRHERIVALKDTDIKFNLDDVQSNFIPDEGDWLELFCKVQWDETKFTNILSSQIVQVISIRPLRTKIKTAVVSQWNDVDGICDRQIYFNKHCIQGGLTPNIGSKVLVEAIESNQGSYNWRAIKLITSEDHVSNDNTDDCDLEEQRSFNVEQKRNIKLTHPISFENVHFQTTSTLEIHFTNNSNNTYTLIKWKILGSKSSSQIVIPQFIYHPIKIYPNKSISFNIICQPKFLGKSKEILVLVFNDFFVKRWILINVTDPATMTQESNIQIRKFNDSNNITAMNNIRQNSLKTVIPGIKPIKPPHFVHTRLGSFEIPVKMWNAVLGDTDQTAYSCDFNKIVFRIETAIPCLSGDVNINNYIDKWHSLLFMEEIQQNLQMRCYDNPKTFLTPCDEYLSLDIIGLSEKRPSLIKGDKVIARGIYNSNTPNYEGYIHAIRGDKILIKFNPQFHEIYSGYDVSLEFHFNRSVYRKCHQAINLAINKLGPDLLFPSRIKLQKPQVTQERLQTIKWYNSHLNNGQKSAIINILLGECRPMPYCIFGPPGTGKTITLVETILQILTILPESRILVATPSNSASNLLTERLIQYQNVLASSGSVIRLIAHHLLESESIPDVIKPFCATVDIATESTNKAKHAINKDGINIMCQSSFIGRHRVTIGTCVCLGMLAQMKLPRGHFTHVIVDEAGQATEPEIMIPLTFTDKENGQIILAGDPMQLGPVVMSKYSSEFGMDESYLSRILERFPYQKDFKSFNDAAYDKRLITRLTDNYRSIKEVFSISSKMFYDNSLVPRITKDLIWISEMLNCIKDILPNENGGIYVYGIKGVNARGEDSPSWYNPQEASMILLYTCKLYKRNIKPDQIGIITPYIAQIKLLRRLFDSTGSAQPKIGTVEEFQGQEKPIILISTVRSNEGFIEQDLKHTLGFLRNPKRLNVALTRAQVAVVLFCNPHVLCKDVLWKRVISESILQNKYTGCDLPDSLQSEMKDIVENNENIIQTKNVNSF